jgi:outer membrane autotransporter protein
MRKLSTCTGWIVAAAMALPVFAPQAAAQEFDFVQAIVKPQVNIERARHLRRLIRERGEDLLKRRMGAGATGTVYPLAYGEDGVEAVEAEAAEPKGINLWIDGNGGRLEDSNALRGYDGTQYALSFGGDAQLSERVILGAVGVYSGSNIDNSFVPGGSSTRAFGLGPYAAVFLTDTVVMTGSLLRTWTDNRMNGLGVTAGYDSRDWMLNANVTSYHFAGNWQFAPTAGISYGVESEDGYVDSSATAFAASETRTGSFAFGGKIAYTHALANGMTVEPSLEAEGEWTFERTTTATTTLPRDEAEFDLTVTGGLDVAISENTSFSLSGAVSGLAKPDYLSFTGGARLGVAF